MITCASGDFFDYEADIRINTVNCVGVMGAGVALEFKTRYPDMFRAYVKACKNNELAPGKPYIWEEYSLFSHCTIINLPTKVHWRDPSRYEYIEADLIWLRQYLKDKEAVVTLPALGCGHGGLNWEIVKSQIHHYLEDVKAKILLFEPSSSNRQWSDPHFGLLSDRRDITALYPDSDGSPAFRRLFAAKELYCRGNTDLLRRSRLSVLTGNSLTDRERSAIEKILQEIPGQDWAVVLAVNNRQHLALALQLLALGTAVILVPPGGILKFKHDRELEAYKDRFAILSFKAPQQDTTRYSYIESLKYRCAVADAILCAGENLADIRRDGKYLRAYSNLFYINYWTENPPEFAELHAGRIGIDRETGKPNVLALRRYLQPPACGAEEMPPSP